MIRAVALLVLLLPLAARAQDLKDRFNIRVGLTGGYVTESQSEANAIKRAQSTFSLGYADLRVVMDARRLPGKFELHLDGRVRISGEYSSDAARVAANQVVARGYLGGREYELREAFVRRRGLKVDVAFGRMFVYEADAMKIDGVRLWYRFNKHWDLSFFAGGYPNPYSRSVTTDYQGAKGYYGVSIGGGADFTYTYDKIWGSVSAVGMYLGGNDDGGRLVLTAPTGMRTTEAVRAFLTWTSFERFVHWLDIYHSLVLDVAGAAGVQLTRLNVFATARAGKYLSIRAGYDHMSSIAIEMFLTNLLQNRGDFALTNTISNNLIVNRTARDEGRLGFNVGIKKVNLFAEGRLRFRSLINPGEDPQFTLMGAAPANIAWDATLGVRDSGSLRGVRLGLWYTYLSQFRSTHYILGAELGRSFFDERFTFDLTFLYAKSRDAGAGDVVGCPPLLLPLVPGPTASPQTVGCFGVRDGASYETGITFTGNPFRRWFALLDYRLVVNETDKAPVILTHLLMLRIEARY
jgi:hypothetical protein